MKKLDYYEIYDESTNKILFIKAYSDEEAIGISETIDFNDYENLACVDVLDEISEHNFSMDLITEETEVEYTNDEQLSYELYKDDYIELYVDDFYIGLCEVWLDAEMDSREYIILNYTIIYLDSIKLR
jgi:hypothetical protein